MRVFTSRVFACMRQLHTTLTAAAWTSHPTTGEKPLVVFGGTGLAAALETVVIVGVPEDSARMDWVVLNPPMLEEQFALLVRVETMAPGATNDLDDGGEVFSRLEDLCDIAQTALRNQTSGLPAGGFETLDGFNNVWKWSVAQVSPRIDPYFEGWVGSADLVVSFTTRI